jgi:carboxylesterase type B
MRLQLCISAVLAQVHTGCAAQLYSWSVGSLEPGSDLHIANYSNLTAAEEWCSSHSLCQGFTYDGGAHGGAPLGPVPLEPLPGPGGDRRPCYLRSDINISACGNGTRHLFVLDMDTSQWRFVGNKTCDPPTAADIPPAHYGADPQDWPYGPFGPYDARSGEWAHNSTVPECQRACEATPNCSGINVDFMPWKPPAPPLPAPLEATVPPRVWQQQQRQQTYTVFFKLGITRLQGWHRNWTSATKQDLVSHVEVNTTLGVLWGTRSRSSGRSPPRKSPRALAQFDQFLGIRYAEPVNGTSRWRRPRPKRPWAGVVNATSYGANCPSQSQPSGLPNGIAGLPYDEDCAFLNIWRPVLAADPTSKKLPVLLWIHGGSFIGGSGAQSNFNGSEIVQVLAETDTPIIFVTINYRLGVFGFLGADELRYRTVDNSTGNYGQTDQREAMRWVQANIGAFGGDKDRVMVLGQSSGAGSVSTHLVTPASWGLFHVAAMISGAFGTWISAPMNATPPLAASEGAQATFDALADETNCSAAGAGNAVSECLVALSANEITRTWTTIHAAFGPVVDGVELTDTPHELLRQGKINTQLRAVLVGSTSEDSGAAIAHNSSSADFRTYFEAEYLFADYVNKTPAILEQMMGVYGPGGLEQRMERPPVVFPSGFPPRGMEIPPGNWSHCTTLPPSYCNGTWCNSTATASCFTDWYWAAKHAEADAEMFCPARMAARHFTRLNVTTYQYQWRHAPLQETCLKSSDVCNPSGAPHSSDIPFWFSIKTGGDCVRSTEELALAHQMSHHLANLVTHGRPTPMPSDPSWPAWDEASESVLVLEAPSMGGSVVTHHMRTNICEIWATVPDKYLPNT